VTSKKVMTKTVASILRVKLQLHFSKPPTAANFWLRACRVAAWSQSLGAFHGVLRFSDAVCKMFCLYYLQWRH